MYPKTYTNLKGACSDAKRNYLKHLLVSTDWSGDREQYRSVLERDLTQSLTKDRASKWIGWLSKQPKVNIAAAAPESLDLGYYLLNGSVYVVVEAKTNKSHRYAKRLSITPDSAGAWRANWQYEQGAMKLLKPSDRLTESQAADMGRMYGICVVCARTLTDPESVQRGMGETCAKKLQP